jgi:hypothetical protein
MDNDDIHVAVSQAFNEADPAALLRAGFPSHEYDQEVNDVTNRLTSGQPISKEMVEEVLRYWFHLENTATTDNLFDALKRQVGNLLS